jgi:hypothetical protein
MAGKFEVYPDKAGKYRSASRPATARSSQSARPMRPRHPLPRRVRGCPTRRRGASIVEVDA